MIGHGEIAFPVYEFLLGKITALDGCGFPLHSLEVRPDIQALVAFRAQMQADPFNKG